MKQMESYVCCTLKSNGSRVCKTTFTIKFRCMQHEDCKKKYQLVCKRLEKINGCYSFQILFSKDKINHTRKMVRQCRGIDRVVTRRKLAKKTAEEYREAQISRSNRAMLKKGNLQSVYSVEVMRKLRSEALRKDELHQEAITELGKNK